MENVDKKSVLRGGQNCWRAFIFSVKKEVNHLLGGSGFQIFPLGKNGESKSTVQSLSHANSTPNWALLSLACHLPHLGPY